MISNKIKNGIVGKINIPSDKSISHRSIIIPSISKGISEINNLLMSDDVLHTLNAFKTLGVKIEKSDDKIIIYGKGLNSLKKPKKNIGVLITDHNVRETLKIIDKVYIVNEGGIYFEGSPNEAVSNEDIKKFYLGSDFKI